MQFGFNLGEMGLKNLQIGDIINVIGNLQINEFNGNKNIQLNLKDFKKAN